MEKRIRFTIILVLILIVVIAFSFQSKEKKEYLVYNEALDKTAVTVDDVSLTLKDIAFYVAYEEKTVQEQAILYNPDNPRQYWNVYTDGQFVKLTAKQAALDMAVHDEIFYQMAVAEGVKLDVTEQEYLENDESDFWSDLEDWQREQLGISDALQPLRRSPQSRRCTMWGTPVLPNRGPGTRCMAAPLRIKGKA